MNLKQSFLDGLLTQEDVVNTLPKAFGNLVSYTKVSKQHAIYQFDSGLSISWKDGYYHVHYFKNPCLYDFYRPTKIIENLDLLLSWVEWSVFANEVNQLPVCGEVTCTSILDTDLMRHSEMVSMRPNFNGDKGLVRNVSTTYEPIFLDESFYRKYLNENEVNILLFGEGFHHRFDSKGKPVKMNVSLKTTSKGLECYAEYRHHTEGDKLKYIESVTTVKGLKEALNTFKRILEKDAIDYK